MMNDDYDPVIAFYAVEKGTGKFYNGQGFGSKAKVYRGRNHITSSMTHHGIPHSSVVIHKCELLTVEVFDGEAG